MSADSAGFPSSGAQFPSTLWTQVAAAGAGAAGALETLAQRYWKPVYAWLRRSGRPAHDAADLTQGFFLALITGSVLQRADRDRGRFRSYLLACLRNFMSDDFDRASALKRGGGKRPLSLDVEGAERVLAVSVEADPDRQFERQWALEVMERALGRLKGELRDRAKEVFELAHAGGGASQKEIGERLGMREDAVAASLYRSRQRLREVLLEEVSATIGEGEDPLAELQNLMAALGPAGREARAT